MVLQQGFIALHRSLLDWEWYKDTNTKAVFIHLLLTVNYKPQKWRGNVIERGQRVCSHAGLAEEIGLTTKEIRTAIKHLISTGEIVWKGKPQYSLVQVVNYNYYQEGANEGQAKGKPGANEGQQCNKAIKNNKAIINNNLPIALPGIVEVLSGLQVDDNASLAQEQTVKLLEQSGYICQKEYPVPDRGDGVKGRVDIVARRDDEVVAIEFDRLSPREKSIYKLRQIKDAIKVILLRGGTVGKNIPGITVIPVGIKTPGQATGKVQWAEHVTMTNEQHQKLLEAYGEADTLRLIEILDNYKGAKGKRYEDDYRAILS